MRLVGSSQRSCRYRRLYQFILLSFLVGGSAFAVSPKPIGQADSSRAININLKELEQDSVRNGEFSFFLVRTSGTGDIESAWGGAIAYDYVKFEPLLFRIGMELTRSDFIFDRFEGEPFVSIGIDGGVLFRGRIGRVRPYVGIGVTAYNNFWPSDEGPRDWIGPYDECTCSNYDYGSSLATHVRVGTQVSVMGRVSIVTDFKYTYSRPTTDMILRNDLTGEESDITIKYDRRVLSSLLGISIRL